MTFEKLLNIKNNKLEIFEWSYEEKNLSNFNLTQKDFKIKSKKVTSFIKYKYICFELESNPILFDLANILNYILFNKYNDNSVCFEHIVLGRSAIAIRYSRFLGYFQYYLIRLAIEEWFESVMALYKEESSKNSFKVRRSLTDSINIFEVMDNNQIKKSLYYLLELMQKYEKEN